MRKMPRKLLSISETEGWEPLVPVYNKRHCGFPQIECDKQFINSQGQQPMRFFSPMALAIMLLISTLCCAQSAGQSDSSAVIPTTPGSAADDPAFTGFQPVTKEMKPPKATSAPDPKFPSLPADAEPRGTVVLLIGVSTKGHVDAVRVLHSDETAFEQTAVATVKKWKFRPAEKDGHPVAVQVTVEMKFQR
jgi:TonB family protein